MGDQYPVVKVAAVQAASVFLDREATTAKACALIREAGANGARVIGFPEGYIPAHPVWYHHHAATGPVANDLAVELFKNAIEIPGPEVEALCAAARDANAYVVVGACEKLPRTIGTMYNSQLFIGPDGALIGVHRKLMPTGGERIVHMGGAGDTFGAVATEFGPMSGLICGENSNPLAIFALTAEGTRIHVMSWPPYLGRAPLGNRVAVDGQAFAQMSKAFVVCACGVVDETMLAALALPQAEADELRQPGRSGGSLIVAPNGRVIAGPLGAEEGVLYADCDIEIGVQMKLRHDFAGHYNRPDIFQLHVNRAAPRIYNVHTTPEQLEASAAGTPIAAPAADKAGALPAPQPRLAAPRRAARKRTGKSKPRR